MLAQHRPKLLGEGRLVEEGGDQLLVAAAVKNVVALRQPVAVLQEAAALAAALGLPKRTMTCAALPGSVVWDRRVGYGVLDEPVHSVRRFLVAEHLAPKSVPPRPLAHGPLVGMPQDREHLLARPVAGARAPRIDGQPDGHVPPAARDLAEAAVTRVEPSELSRLQLRAQPRAPVFRNVREQRHGVGGGQDKAARRPQKAREKSAKQRHGRKQGFFHLDPARRVRSGVKIS
mmetsp:Transcript_73638/g.199138  ORF Transcript_73638/g.199138 Transcript_73638/m.199138 type:complete len:231 (-) Transcript_73638:8-700(-)